jgi:uncharacterized protein (TIGR00251 family)
MISVRVTPNAKKSEILSRGPGEWKIKLASPPIDGRANEALIELLAEEFDCAPSLVQVVKGHTSRTKQIKIG